MDLEACLNYFLYIVFFFFFFFLIWLHMSKDCETKKLGQ